VSEKRTLTFVELVSCGPDTVPTTRLIATNNTEEKSVYFKLLGLHFAYVVDVAKYIVVTAVCLCVCLFLAAFPHYCTDPDVTWGNGTGCLLVVHYWVDLQSVHGFRCCDNIAANAKCQRVLVLAHVPS